MRVIVSAENQFSTLRFRVSFDHVIDVHFEAQATRSQYGEYIIGFRSWLEVCMSFGQVHKQNNKICPAGDSFVATQKQGDLTMSWVGPHQAQLGLSQRECHRSFSKHSSQDMSQNHVSQVSSKQDPFLPRKTGEPWTLSLGPRRPKLGP